MLKVNYSDLCGKTREQIEKEANKRGLRFGRYTETRDIIGMIIAHDAYYEGKNDATREQPKSRIIKAEEPREKYLLHDENNNEDYYLELTKAQVNFFIYLDEGNIYPRDATLEPINDITFEAP